MTSSFLQEYIPQRMEELGFGADYRVTMRTLNLEPSSNRILNAYNRYFYFPLDLLGYSWSIEIESNFGYYSRQGTHSEQGYEHTGKIRITNPVSFTNSVTFFEVIPSLQSNTKPSNA